MVGAVCVMDTVALGISVVSACCCCRGGVRGKLSNRSIVEAPPAGTGLV